jgi:hypothetical protein
MPVLILGSSAAADTGNGNGLLFPSNVSGSDTAAPFVALQFDAPHLDGLPLWGPSGQGTTWIWRYKPTQQTGYYVTFWHGRGDGFFSNADGYYGAHPYPTSESNAGTAHQWEIAIIGGDFRDTVAGPRITVVKDVWYTQALRVTRASANSKTLRFYTNLPSVADADIVEITISDAGYGETTTPEPKVTIADSPWFATNQHERMSGLLSHFQIYSKVLSETDTVSEAAALISNGALATAEGAANIWWGKKGFATVDALTCDYGTGRSFVWADPDNKATLVSAA